MADVKLGHFGVRHRFRFGAFGDEAPDRNALARVAIERAEQRFGLDAARCVVVGDTVHDVACARAAGAWAIAVATGVQSHAELAASAPDLLLDGLTDAQPLLELAAQAREGARPSS
jgi:phosphoglycolate phosphatase-like HAD superfamily hydrolase